MKKISIFLIFSLVFFFSDFANVLALDLNVYDSTVSIEQRKTAIETITNDERFKSSLEQNSYYIILYNTTANVPVGSSGTFYKVYFFDSKYLENYKNSAYSNTFQRFNAPSNCLHYNDDLTYKNQSCNLYFFILNNKDIYLNNILLTNMSLNAVEDYNVTDSVHDETFIISKDENVFDYIFYFDKNSDIVKPNEPYEFLEGYSLFGIPIIIPFDYYNDFINEYFYDLELDNNTIFITYVIFNIFYLVMWAFIIAIIYKVIMFVKNHVF